MLVRNATLGQLTSTLTLSRRQLHSFHHRNGPNGLARHKPPRELATSLRPSTLLTQTTQRIMSSSEGAPTIQPFRMYPPLMPAPDKWDEKIFVGLDRCIAEAGKRGMRLTMSLNNEWHWSGGFAQYVSWFNKDEQCVPRARGRMWPQTLSDASAVEYPTRLAGILLPTRHGETIPPTRRGVRAHGLCIYICLKFCSTGFEGYANKV